MLVKSTHRQKLIPSLLTNVNWVTDGCKFLTIIGLVCLTTTTLSAQEQSGFKIRVKSGQDRQISYYVGRGLEDGHLLQRPIDDEISERALRIFLKRLDSRKYYFIQSDIDEFQEYATTLDELLLNRDVSPGTIMFLRYIERIDDRVKDIKELLSGEFDFSVDEEVVTSGEEETYAADSAAARDRWRKRLKHELLVLQQTDDADNDEGEPEAGDDEKESPTEILMKRYVNFQRRMKQTDSDEVLEYYLTAITSSFDPHSNYFSPSSLEDFRIRMGLNYQGIGAELSDVDGKAIIQRIMSNGGADKAGELKAGDRIIGVGQGKDGDMVDVSNSKLQDIIELIRGPEGTLVRLNVIPKGETDVQTYSITRTRIELADNAAKSVIMEVGEGDEKIKVGAINLPSFYLDMNAVRRNDPNARSTTRDVQRLLVDFKKNDVDAVIVDLRRNGGGSLPEAVSLTGLFIKQGPIVQVKDPVNGIVRQSDRNPSIAWNGPLVVLNSRFSASASEIFAGALQDYRRALIVGDSSTHGKGTVQSLQELGPAVFKTNNPLNLGALKITIQQFYRPSGASTQNRGVISDVVVPSFAEHFSEGEAALDYAIPFDEIPASTFSMRDDTSVQIIAELQKRSGKRVAESEEFSLLNKRIASYRERQKQKTIPLQKEKFNALRKQIDDDRKEQQRLFIQNDGKGDVVTRDYYFEEILAITADYVRQSSETDE
ncbi:MAG: carboxy terminal-processing peptidase [Pirellulaceae bacterium]